MVSAMRVMAASRVIRDRLFSGFASFLVSLGVRAWMVSLVSVLSGLLAVLYLFHNHAFFLFFGFLNLVLDSLNGVVARVHGPVKNGCWWDYFADRISEVFYLVKALFVFQFAWLAPALAAFVVSNVLFLRTNRFPGFSRLTMFIFFAIGLGIFGLLIALVVYSVSIVLNVFWLTRDGF